MEGYHLRHACFCFSDKQTIPKKQQRYRTDLVSQITLLSFCHDPAFPGAANPT